MGWRNPLVVKKRGARRTGVQLVGHWSELLLSLSLVVVGATMLTLHICNVLLPEVRQSRKVQGFVKSECRVVETNIDHTTSPIGAPKYVLNVFASRIEEGKDLPPVWVVRSPADFSPSQSDAELLAKRYSKGSVHPCWYDPNNTKQIVLGRNFGWWPWPVALIPASLLAVGVWGIVASLMQVAASAERRSLVSVKAARLDPLRETPTESATLPAYDSEVDNPGIRFGHRLQVSGTARWRMMGLFFVSAVWNAVVAYFLYVASLQYLEGDPPWLAAGLVILLGLVGVWLAFHLVRELWQRRGIGPTQVEISDLPLHLGGTFHAYLLQQGRMTLGFLAVRLVLEEVANFEQGTNSRTSVHRAYVRELRKWKGLRVDPGQPFEAEFELEIPPDAMHSFRSEHNEVRWLIEVEGSTKHQQQTLRSFVVAVAPPSPTPSLADQLAGDLVEPTESPT